MFEVRCKFRPTHLTLLATPVEPFPHHFHRQRIEPYQAFVINFATYLDWFSHSSFVR